MTTTMAPAIELPKLKGRMVRELSTRTAFLSVDRVPLPADITPYEREYTDRRFYADLKKAGGQLDRMAREALKEHSQGRTRKFPE